MFRASFIEKGLDIDKAVCLWGAGNKGKKFKEYLDVCGIKAGIFFDNDKSKHGSEYGKVHISNFNGKIPFGQIIVTVDNFFDEISAQILQQGGKDLLIVNYMDIYETYGKKIEIQNGSSKKMI